MNQEIEFKLLSPDDLEKIYNLFPKCFKCSGRFKDNINIIDQIKEIKNSLKKQNQAIVLSAFNDDIIELISVHKDDLQGTF